MSWVGDSENLRWVCRIMAITFNVAKSLPPGTISRSWVAKYLNRSEDFVKKNWNKDPFCCEMNSAPKEDGISLSQESQQIIVSSLAKEKKSIRKLQKDILEIRGKRRSYGAIRNFLVSLGAKPFHQTPGPKISQKNKEDRLWFCDYLSNWEDDDFLFVAPSDEFYIYEERRPNFQNDRIWALNIDDIPEEVKVRGVSKHPKCVGVFLMFTAKRLMWVVKEKGCSWDGNYFRQEILAHNVIPFLKNKRNVMEVCETTFLHDRAPCMSALATQNMLTANGIDFFGNGEWPGSSPDLNPCENLGAILKDRVEQRLEISGEGLEEALHNTLVDMEYDTDLFTSLLLSIPSRLTSVREAKGGHTKF